MSPLISHRRLIAASGSRRAFTIVEMLVSTAVLVLIMVMIGKLFNSAVAVTALRGKEMDADAQARAVFDRMAVDFSQMVKRPDVDYYLKTNAQDQYQDSAQSQSAGSTTSGTNDQLAFYSQVPGYYPSANYPSGSTSAQQSPLSLVGYRVNSSNQLQRFGYGLEWNGVQTSGDTQMIFSSGTNGDTCSAGSYNAISFNFLSAINPTAPDSNYETSGPQVFRFEYYYVLKGSGATYPSILSDIPWDVRQGHNSVNGLQDVAAIGVAIAVADPKSQKMLVKPGQSTSPLITALAATMPDFPSTNASSGLNSTLPGALEASWVQAIQAEIQYQKIGIPPIAASAIRVYGRTFYLPAN